MRLLLIEDDDLLGHGTSRVLARAGHEVDWTRTAAQARSAVLTADYDAILLDLGLPDQSGADFLRELRTLRRTTPVVVLTARGQLDDRVHLLDLGADDYLIKPYDISELLARLRAVMRRTNAQSELTDTPTIGPLRLQQDTRSVLWRGRAVVLSTKEYEVLQLLVAQRPRIVSRAQLAQALYGWDEGVDSNSIEVYIHGLRRKIAPEVVVTVRGRGYQLGGEEALHAAARMQASA